MKLLLIFMLIQSASLMAQDCVECEQRRMRGAALSGEVNSTNALAEQLSEQTIGAVRNHLCGLAPRMITTINNLSLDYSFRGTSTNDQELRLTDFLRTIYYLTPNHQGRPALDPNNYDHWLQFINNWNQIQGQLYCPAFDNRGRRIDGSEHILKQFTQEGKITLITEIFSRNVSIKNINTNTELLNGRPPLPRFNLESNCHQYSDTCPNEDYATYLNRTRPFGTTIGETQADTALRAIYSSLNREMNPICVKQRGPLITGNVTQRVCAQ